MNVKEFQVLILAAGKGTRMRSNTPKVLHRVCGLTMIERTLAALAPLKPTRITVVVGYGGEAVRAEVNRCAAQLFASDVAVSCVEQQEQRGTGHAVAIALPHLGEKQPILILPGDIPLLDTTTLSAFLDAAGAAENSASCLHVLSARVGNPFGFGRIVREDLTSNLITRIVEERDCTPEQADICEINTSIYFAEPAFLRRAVPQLSTQNKQAEYYLTDVVQLSTKEKHPAVAILCGDETRVLGANSRSELAKLEKLRRQEINLAHMDAGVTMLDPETVYIDEGVLIGADSLIGPSCQLLGRTVVGERVVIDGNALLRHSTINSGTRIKLGCVVEDSHVGEACQLGPYAHLRPGSVLERDVHVGNFVETKKTHLGSGAKANHLTYLGDAQIGEKVNVGAGTITCNYDGYGKYETVIESGAFIGSNTSLVAPVRVGAGSVTGAGSVITKDVPADALAIERGEQRHISEWARKHREKRLKK